MNEAALKQHYYEVRQRLMGNPIIKRPIVPVALNDDDEVDWRVWLIPSAPVPVMTPGERTEKIIRSIANKHGTTSAEMKGPSRSNNVVRARHETFAALRELGMSTSQIGNVFNKDHTTVLNGLIKHKLRMTHEIPDF